MEREIDLRQISDGRLYTANDMVKAACNDCKGCSLCCHGMGKSIILDTYDIYQLQRGIGLSFEQLLEDKIELNVVDGVILPNLKMQGSEDCCAFLSSEGRCSVHAYRPGFCRMFPLGRIYEGHDFKYFLQIYECPYPNKTKIKLKKWLEISDIGSYENYVKTWHYFLKSVQEIIKNTENDVIIKNLNMYLLNQFYVKPYDTDDDFFHQFEMRMLEAEQMIKAYC